MFKYYHVAQRANNINFGLEPVSGICTRTEVKQLILELNENSESGRRYVVMPNQAMPWRKLRLWYFIISMFSLGVGVYFFSIGMPLVLPFSGLEVIALGCALYLSAWKSNEKQVIKISSDLVEV